MMKPLSSFFLLLCILFHAPLLVVSSPSSSLAPSLRKLSTNLTTIYFIGDLHGDVGCAKQWVEKTKLVNISSSPYQWKGSNQNEEAIVFLGDYVDKGSTSGEVLLFVKELQETFPDNIVTILGNHDFFLLLDTALYFDSDNPHPLGFPHYDYPFSYFHPEEYLESDWVQNRDDDEEIYNIIATALQDVYDKKLQTSTHMCSQPTCNMDKQVDLFSNEQFFEKLDTSTTGSNNSQKKVEMRKKAQDRLAIWRKEYAKGLFDSGLLEWMTKQPLITVVGDALVVHGGLSGRLVDYLEAVAKNAEEGVVSVAESIHASTNVQFQEFFQEQLKKVSNANAITGRMTGKYTLAMIMDMIQHRGYFKGANGCAEVNHVINKVNDDGNSNEEGISENDDENIKNANDIVNRIVVGHTPRKYAEELCDGKLVANDSSLSRSFRAHGNYYCPLIEKRFTKHMNGRCSIKPDIDCDGSISKISRSSPSEPWPSSVKLMLFNDDFGHDDRNIETGDDSVNDEL